MEWSWERIPAEFVVTNVLLARGGAIAAGRVSCT
jgi:hypothetical protein